MYSKSEAKELITRFWEDFARYTDFFGRKKKQKIEWMLYKTGIKGLELKFDLHPRYVKCIIEVNARNEDRRLDIFIELNNYRKFIQNGFKKPLVWDENVRLDTGKQVMRVYCELTGKTFHNPENWPDIFCFMAENMWQLQSNFEEILPIFEEKYKYNP
jgi:hypothetical protein